MDLFNRPLYTDRHFSAKVRHQNRAISIRDLSSRNSWAKLGNFRDLPSACVAYTTRPFSSQGFGEVANYVHANFGVVRFVHELTRRLKEIFGILRALSSIVGDRAILKRSP